MREEDGDRNRDGSMEPFGFESGPSRAMSTFKSHEENYHRCSQAINRHINGLQLGKVEAVAAIDLPVDLEEADQYVSSTSVSSTSTFVARSLMKAVFRRIDLKCFLFCFSYEYSAPCLFRPAALCP